MRTRSFQGARSGYKGVIKNDMGDCREVAGLKKLLTKPKGCGGSVRALGSTGHGGGTLWPKYEEDAL